MAITLSPAKKKRTRTRNSVPVSSQPFRVHLRELRRRLCYVVVSVVLGAVAAYAVEQQIIAALLRPSNGQQFIYTTPGGGMDFLFRIAIYIGLICSIPVIIYQLLKFMEPLLPRDSNRFINRVSVASGVLAVVGMIFGYFIGLPNALHFLLHQFTTAQIKPLVTIQAYTSFVMVYMLGSALLLQAPLILIFINRVTPLKPSSLLKQERWVILIAFVGAFIMNPTPNLIAQTFVAVPIIVAYHIGVALVWLTNRRGRRHPKIQALLDQDAALQAERLELLRQAQTIVPETYNAVATAVTNAIQEFSPAKSAAAYAPAYQPQLQEFQLQTVVQTPAPAQEYAPIAQTYAPVRQYATSVRRPAARPQYRSASRSIDALQIRHSRLVQ